MSAEADDLRILRLHKTWADRYTLLWHLMILLLFAGAWFLLNQSGVDAAERAGAFVFLAVMILAAAVWQAVGLAVARVHMLLIGIDLEARSKGDNRPNRDRP